MIRDTGILFKLEKDYYEHYALLSTIMTIMTIIISI